MSPSPKKPQHLHNHRATLATTHDEVEEEYEYEYRGDADDAAAAATAAAAAAAARRDDPLRDAGEGGQLLREESSGVLWQSTPLMSAFELSEMPFRSLGGHDSVLDSMFGSRLMARAGKMSRMTTHARPVTEASSRRGAVAGDDGSGDLVCSLSYTIQPEPQTPKPEIP